MSPPVEAPPHARAETSAFAADLRSLAAFRIALGAAVLVDLAQRVPDLEAHYSDAGILPRSMLPPFGRLALPLHRLTGAASVEGVLFAIAGVVAVAMLVGYRTRLAAALSWTMLLSLHGRNPLVLSGGDPLLRLMLFWSMFLPIGAAWSVDAARRRAPGGPPRELRSIAVVVVFLQIAAVYFFTGVLKLENGAWRGGEAIRFALISYHVATPLGTWMLGFPRLLRVLTYGVLVLEIVGPIFLFWPRRWLSQARLLTLLAFLGLQVGIWLTMPIGNFQPMSVLLMLPLVPAAAWDWILPRLAGARLGAALERLSRGGSPEEAAADARRQRIPDGVAGALGVYLLGCNVWTVFSAADMPGRPERLAYALGVDQRWEMFIMNSGLVAVTGWMAAPARLEDGTSVDLLTGDEPPRRDKPEAPRDIYGGWRWHRFVTKHIWSPDERYRALYAAHLCRKWNRGHPSRRAVSIELGLFRQMAAEDGVLRPAFGKSLWQGACPDVAAPPAQLPSAP